MNANISDPLSYMSFDDISETVNAMEKRLLSLYNIAKCSVGFEYEFYCLSKPTKQFFDDVTKIDGLYDLKQELGKLQFEITTVPQNSFLEACHVMYWVRKSLRSLANKHNIATSFRAVTFLDGNPPSSMQASICFYDKNDTILDSKSKTFMQAVQSLVHNLYSSIFLMCPTHNCYSRIANITIAKEFKNSPTHITWGTENRTLAIRIADVANSKIGNRIEYRVPSPISSPYYIALGMLASMICVSNVEYSQTFVDSWEAQTDRLPITIGEAYYAFIRSPLLDTIHSFSYQHAV